MQIAVPLPWQQLFLVKGCSVVMPFVCPGHTLVAAAHTNVFYTLQLVEGAEAKACWGLKTNWQALQAVTELLMFKGTITGGHS